LEPEFCPWMVWQCKLNVDKVQQNGFNFPDAAVAPPKVLLTENVRWPNVALLAIRLAKAGSSVSAVCPSGHPLRLTRAVRQTFPYSSLRPLESLSVAIGAVNPDIIIPCDDRAVQHLHELHGRTRSLGAAGKAMAELIEKSLGLPESYDTVFDRTRLLRIAREEGLRVPETVRLNSLSDLKSWHAQQPFPWVLKTDGTFGGTGVKIAHTFAEAERYWHELSHYYTAGRALKRLCVNRDAFWFRPWWKGARPNVSVQVYVRGRPANSAMVCWQGRVLADVGVEVVSSAGLTGPANVVRVVNNSDMKEAAERLAARLGLSGFFGFDFMIEDGSGLTHLIEMNPRLTRPSCLQLGGRRDLVAALSAQLSGRPFRPEPPFNQDKLIAYFPDALTCKSEFLAACVHDTPEGEASLVQAFLKPWPPKGVFWHLVNQLDRLKQFGRSRDSGSNSFRRVDGPSPVDCDVIKKLP